MVRYWTWLCFFSVLRIRIRDPVPFWPLEPGSGMGKKLGSGSGIRDLGWTTRIIFPRAYKPFLWVKILEFFDADPGSGMGTIRIRDGKKSDPGSGINIPDPQHFFFSNYLCCGVRWTTPSWKSCTKSTNLKLEDSPFLPFLAISSAPRWCLFSNSYDFCKGFYRLVFSSLQIFYDPLPVVYL